MIVVGIVPLSCATGEQGRAVEFEATLSGEALSESSATNPIELHHAEVVELALSVENVSDVPVEIAHVRLEGELLDMIFLTYDTGVHEPLAPGEQRSLRFPIDFFDLDGQAHGLLRSRVQLFDAERNVLGGQSLVVDGRGSPLATTVTFNLVLVGVALLAFAWNLREASLGRLPENALARGVRFVPGSLAAGLAISVASSTLRIWPLPAMVWIPITLLVAGGGFLFGYVSPGSDLEPGVSPDWAPPPMPMGAGPTLVRTVPLAEGPPITIRLEDDDLPPPVVVPVSGPLLAEASSQGVE